jgi:IS5 family transposase
MYTPPTHEPQQSFFFNLEASLDSRHPLFILANTIHWDVFEEAFKKFYHPTHGRPCKPIRLMTGLLILKNLRNLSDESVVEQWAENNYYQYFCGNTVFTPENPCDDSELANFRSRIGPQGVELILKESIRINGKDAQERDVVVDTTVQEKNITFPTDAKLHRKIIKKCWKIAEHESVDVRQSYTRELKRLALSQRFRSHPRNKGKAKKADRRVKTIAGRLVRELQRRLPADSRWHGDLAFYTRVLAQHKDSSPKIYSLHEREVQCIAKGKDRVKYEFGNKVSITYTKTTGVVTGALSFRNPYDGHTLAPVLDQHERLTGLRARSATCDRGYKGQREVGGTQIQIPDTPNVKARTAYQKRKLRRDFRRRAAIEPIIGHLKTDHRLGRNFLWGVRGDAVNVLMACAAFNFKRMMNKWKRLLSFFVFFLSNPASRPSAGAEFQAA